MLKEILKALTGSVQTAAFSYPVGANIPPSQTFGRILNNTFNSLSANSFSGPVGIPYGAQGQNPAAAQAYQNSLLQYSSGFNTKTNGKREVLSPGSVLTQLTAPPAQVNQFANQAAPGIIPLQGFAGQGGVIQGSYPTTGINNQFLPATFGTPLGAGFGQIQGKLGILGFVIGPVLGIFGLFKSLFTLRSTMASLQPEKVNKEDISYKNTLENYAREESAEGGFDDSYWGETKEGFTESSPEHLEEV